MFLAAEEMPEGVPVLAADGQLPAGPHGRVFSPWGHVGAGGSGLLPLHLAILTVPSCCPRWPRPWLHRPARPVCHCLSAAGPGLIAVYFATWVVTDKNDLAKYSV